MLIGFIPRGLPGLLLGLDVFSCPAPSTRPCLNPMKPPRTWLGTSILLIASFASGTPLAPGQHAREFLSSDDATTQPYRLFVPEAAATPASRPLPLLVVLHGWGVDEHAWFKFTPVARIANQFGYVVAAPYARGNWWYRGPAERDVLDVVADVRRLLPIDDRRIYLAGHSMGGWGTWWIGLRHPQMFAAIAPMAGFDPGEAIFGAATLAPFVVHDLTDPVVPVDQSRRPVQRMAELGITHAYREEIGYGHASRMIGDNLPRLFAWFDAHSRTETPRRVSLAAHLGGASNAWLQLLAPGDWPRLALVNAVVDSGGAILVDARRCSAFALRIDTLPAQTTHPLVLELNGERHSVRARTGWVVCRKSSAAATWSVAVAHEPPTPEAPPPLRGDIARNLAQAHAEDRFATAVAELLREHFAVDGCLLDTDKIRLGRAPLTSAALLDAWVYPDGDLAIVSLSPAKLRDVPELISKGRALLVPSDLARSPRERVRVVTPRAIVRQLGVPPSQQEPATDLSLGELLARLATTPPPADAAPPTRQGPSK